MENEIQTIGSNLLSPAPPPTEMLSNHIRHRCRKVNEQDRLAWEQIQNLTDWEAFVRPRIHALQTSLGTFPKPPDDLNIHISETVEGEGYHIQNLVFESRPGIFVSANLYGPAQPHDQMPGIILVHSHHNPKVQGELQDMGILWARSGCRVLVIDQFAYGDRGQHNSGPRQDYYFRYITGLQLHTIGDSLMGWMVWDIHRGVDLLLSQPNADPKKLIVMGSVAGGGDPAAVAAALENRITCAVPFNFGGPQPETTYPLPDNAEEYFNYLGSGSWESTRNLRLSGRDGFLPWVIVGSIAPRHLIYAHEFSWDRDRDPVWKRLQQIYDWYGAQNHLDYTLGFGGVKGRPPHASHCNNIGAYHRTRIYKALQRWFNISPPKQEVEERYPDEKLQSLTPDLQQELTPPKIHAALAQIGNERTATNRQPESLRQSWTTLLGNIQPNTDVMATSQEPDQLNEFTVGRFVIKTDPDISVPALLLRPNVAQTAIAIAISQAGKATFLQKRANEIADLLSAGVAVCLPDVRGTGETAQEGARIPRSRASSLSSSEQMLGQTLLGSRLKDLRSVINYIRNQMPDSPIALWGDGFALTNPVDLTDPLMGEDAPIYAEPLGGLLALFGALFEKDIKAIVARGLFAEFKSVLNNTYCYLPHDAVIPGAVTTGDLCDITTALAPCPLRMENLIDGRNCPLSPETAQRIFTPAQTVYKKNKAPLLIEPSDNATMPWLIEMLRDTDSS
ncbi:MAG: acetylxylan esterase [Candidatus Latescibacteria bacterium]|jgi:dienelactone hydrolase|nr:acetylxylan esterase [Candidatus Latescibacterota bacterium]